MRFPVSTEKLVRLTRYLVATVPQWYATITVYIACHYLTATLISVVSLSIGGEMYTIVVSKYLVSKTGNIQTKSLPMHHNKMQLTQGSHFSEKNKLPQVGLEQATFFILWYSQMFYIMSTYVSKSPGKYERISSWSEWYIKSKIVILHKLKKAKHYIPDGGYIDGLLQRKQCETS